MLETEAIDGEKEEEIKKFKIVKDIKQNFFFKGNLYNE